MSWITGVCSPYVASLCDLHTMLSGKILQFLCSLPCVFRELCLVGFLVVGDKSVGFVVVCSHVDCGDNR